MKEYTVLFDCDEEGEFATFIRCKLMDYSKIEYDILIADGVEITFNGFIINVFETIKPLNTWSC